MKEIWKPINGYEGMYEVSNLGRVKSVERKIYRDKKGVLAVKEKIRKLSNNKGYLSITLDKKEGSKKYKKTYFVHRLVAKAFLKNFGKKEVNHIDGNKKNNSLDNLEWCTRLENVQHAEKLNLVPRQIGEKNGKTFLTETQVREIKKSNLTLFKLSLIYKASMSTISNIKNRITWKHVN